MTKTTVQCAKSTPLSLLNFNAHHIGLNLAQRMIRFGLSNIPLKKERQKRIMNKHIVIQIKIYDRNGQ